MDIYFPVLWSFLFTYFGAWEARVGEVVGGLASLIFTQHSSF